MFTNDNRPNRRFAAITTVAATALLLTTADFAAPKRDVGQGRNRQESFDVKIVRPAIPPSGSGDHEITAGGLRKRDRKVNTQTDVFIVHLNRPSTVANSGPDLTTAGMANRTLSLSPEPAALDGSFVTITTPSPYAGGNHDVTADSIRKRGRKANPQTDVFIVHLNAPSPFRANLGHDITTAGMASRDLSLSPEPATLDGSIVTITTPSPYPGGNRDITADAIRKNGRKANPQTDVFTVYLNTPSTFRTNSGQDITTAAMTAAGTDAASRTESGSAFVKAMDLTSSVRYIGGSPTTTASRNPFADGRAWATLDRESQDGLVATAGWSFLLK